MFCICAFFNFPMCVYPYPFLRSRRRKGCINNICAHRGKQTLTASGCGWPLCVRGDHRNLPRELCRSLIICTALLWKHLCWKRSLSLSVVIRLSSFRSPVSFHLPSYLSACTVSLHCLILPHRSGSLDQVRIVVGVWGHIRTLLNHVFQSVRSIHADKES